MSQHDEQAPRVVIRDKRRIDPTGAARAQGEQMSEQDMGAAPVAEQPVDDEVARQLAERTEDLQRVTAEYANYRRRVDRDRVLVADQAAERFAAQLFPIVDDIERARDHGELTGGVQVVAARNPGLLDGLGGPPLGAGGGPVDPAARRAGTARH